MLAYLSDICQLAVKILDNNAKGLRDYIYTVAHFPGTTLGIAAEILIKEGPCLWVD